MSSSSLGFFFFNDTATTEIYTLSLHDALPIWLDERVRAALARGVVASVGPIASESLRNHGLGVDRKSTRLNSSHLVISYAVFCLKKKNNIKSDSIAKTERGSMQPSQKQRFRFM